MARVQVNRLWQHRFGTGIVATTENLGASGSPPTHPELIDYLAARLIHNGWSMKAMHRLILGSAVYRQSSELNPAAFKVDPDNRLLWRYSLQRLDAESIRDAMLAASGQLDARFGGPYVPTTRDGAGEVGVKPDQPGRLRRSLYLQQRRSQTLSMLGVFDSPSIVFNCIQRPVSTMPLQSLSLLNSQFAVEAAAGFARRIEREAGDDPIARLERAWLIAFARAPSEAQRQSALAFVERQTVQYAAAEDADARAWADLCQMLLASSAFLYIE